MVDIQMWRIDVIDQGTLCIAFADGLINVVINLL